MQLGNLNSNDGLGDTGRHDDDGDVHSINEVLPVNPPPVVVDPPPVYCQITSDSPPPVIMRTQNPRHSMSGNILHSQSKRHGITATLHGTTSHWWAVAASFDSFGQC